MPAARFTVQLIAREPLSARVHRLRFAARSAFRWAAGQHLLVVRGGDRDLALPYSIATAYDPNKPAQFELAVGFQVGADVLDALPVGGELMVEGPAGDFTWQGTPSPAALLVGVGTGIAPLRALIEEELARPTQTRLMLLAGHRVPEDVLFHADFLQLSAAEPRFRFVPTLTAGDQTWLGHRGRVQGALAEAVRTLGPLDAYVCGRLDMVHAVRGELELLGVPAARIRSEGY